MDTNTELDTPLTRAFARLAEAEDPASMRAALDTIFNFNRIYPVRFVGQQEWMNPIVDEVMSKRRTYDDIKLLVDAARQRKDLELMWPPVEEKYDKRTAQRVLMRERRERSKRARLIENAKRSEKDQLRGNARLEFERQALAKWGRELERLLEHARNRPGRDGRLPRDEMARIRHAFWGSVDEQLDKEEIALRKQGKAIK